MGNPDLELQNPAAAPDPPKRRQRRGRPDFGGFCTVAAIFLSILLTIGFWSIVADGTIRPLRRLQCQIIGSHGFAASPHTSRVGGGGGGGDSKPSDKEKAQQCAIDNLHKNTSFLNGVKRINTQEFLQRRDKLAKVLKDEGADAFIIEPGFTFEYYANVSQRDWEPEEPEERPFLMIIQPLTNPDGSITAKTAFLAPHFEVGRVRMLSIPRAEVELDIVVWEEHLDPYETLRKSRLFTPLPPTESITTTTTTITTHKDDDDDDDSNGQQPAVMVDPEMRSFIVGGLFSAGFTFKRLTHAVQLIPQIKTAGEVSILRAVNTASLAVIRAIRPCLVPGLTERQVSEIVRGVLSSMGMTALIDIVLFDANGALPHGGFETGDEVLTYNSMVTMEIGVHYLGHSSDTARSFSIPGPSNKNGRSRGGGGGNGGDGGKKRPKDPFASEKQLVFKTVLAAQAAAAEAMVSNGTVAAEVDIAARRVIEHAGYGYAFTHRLGHGIGVRVHEAPYLNKFNKEERLLPGMVFVDEPGVYLEQRFGVRLADVYLVKENGEQPELLTDRLSMGLDDP